MLLWAEAIAELVDRTVAPFLVSALALGVALFSFERRLLPSCEIAGFSETSD